MPKIAYRSFNFSQKTLRTIAQANQICAEYAQMGFDLTLRQLYYQFVARDLIPNKQTEYKRLGSIINDARLAGLLDWDYIVDRTRNLRDSPHWDSPDDVIEAVAQQFRNQKWDNQPVYVEAWIEKDALIGVLQSACSKRNVDIPYFSCRGYTSQSEVWGAAMRIVRKLNRHAKVAILHLGDHDPSGIDMTRDITDRLEEFVGAHVRLWTDSGEKRIEVRRIALNMDQVEQYDPPPNPAKETDSRFWGYEQEYGSESWELDALDPPVLVGLIEEHVRSLRNEGRWETSTKEEDRQRALLRLTSDYWSEVAEMLEERYGEQIVEEEDEDEDGADT